jgi:uncharacterized repeat protein (TIGR01451 family)
MGGWFSGFVQGQRRHPVGALALLAILMLSVVALAGPPDGEPGVPSAQTTDSDWPMLGHDLARSNATPHQVDPPFGPRRSEAVWVRDFASGDETGSELVFNQYQPIVVGQLVYVGTSRNNMYALDTETGAIVWSYDGAEPGMIMASPAVDDGVLYYAATNGHVYALNGTTGALLWDQEIVGLGGFRTSLAVYDGSIYLGAEDGLFYALNAADGTVRWLYDTGAPILNTAAIDVTRGRIYFANEDMFAFALDLDGSPVWQSAKMRGISTRRFYPVIADDGDAVIFRTSPGSATRALNGGDTLMARAAGLVVPDDFTHIRHGDYGADVYASYDAASFGAEQNGIADWLTNEYPEYETFYVLNAGDGSKRYVAAVLWNGGSGHVGEPPVVAPDGTVYIRARSYWGNMDFDNCVRHFSTPAALDLNTGRLTLFTLPQQNNPYSTGIFMIGDEASAITLGGDRMYFYSHGDVVGSVLTSGTDGGYVTISRDVPHTINSDGRDPALPFGQDVLGHIRFKGGAGGGSSLFGQPVAIADGKVFFVSQGMIGMYESGFNGETNYIAASRETQPTTGPITVPPILILEGYVTEIESYPIGPSAALDVANELEAQVSDLVSGERYAPFFELAGKKAGYIYYRDPTEEAYILAIAYPYLSLELQQQVESYLEDMWAGISDLLQYSFSYTDLTGRRRERYEINNDAGDYAVSSGNGYVVESSERLYHLWAYVHYIGDWGFIVEHWNSIRDVAHNIDPNVIESGSAPHRSVNRRVGSLIGYARMADYLRTAYPDNPDYQSEYEWAVSGAATALQARLQWEEDHRPVGTPWSQQWMQENGGYGVFMDTGWGAGGQIPRYNGLVPVIARVLRDYAWDDMQLQNDFVDTVVPAQHLAWSFIPNRGEVFSNLLPQAREVFLAKALIMEEEPEVLCDYLSYPWCKGDLYYIERLVYTLRRSAPSPGKAVSASSAEQGDILTYTITLVGSGAPVTLTDAIPAGTVYVQDSARREPGIGALDADATAITWTGTLTEGFVLRTIFAVTITAAGPQAIVNQAQVDDGDTHYTFSEITIANGFRVYLPVIFKGYEEDV